VGLRVGAIEEMRSEQDPLASQIFVARRDYQTTSDTKSGKRHERVARMSWQKACNLGFRGQLSEWERLLGAAPGRDWRAAAASRMSAE
jgi:hypothetical protein